jgi:glycosyltransferase involved in cell wall biosynthesis
MSSKKNMPLVSVAIITYNQKDFLHQCIESILAQDYPNIEIIVADDASTDLTQVMLMDYAKRYPDKFIIKLRSENGGITKNSNEAFFACSGKYIAWIGGDDLMLPGKISAQVKWLEVNDNRVICGHLLHLIDQDGHIFGLHNKRLKSGTGPVAWVKNGSLYGSPSVMIRKSSIPDYGFDERLPIVSDWKLWIDSLKPDSIYGFLNHPYGQYRRHLNNITKTNAGDMFVEADLLLSFVEKEKPYLAKFVPKSRAYVICFYKGVDLMLNRKYSEARKFFLRSIKGCPFQKRAYIKLIVMTMEQFAGFFLKNYKI